MTITALPVLATRPRGGSRRHHTFGFWVAAAALLVNMGFSATPLYVLYQRRDHFSTITIMLVYAVYAVGVIASLFLGGHVSDWVGRKRVFVPALLANVAAAAIFLVAPSLAGLLLARVVSGVSMGLTTATATAYLAELRAGTAAGNRGERRGQVVATAANLGGIGFGPLLAGLLAQDAPQPLRLPYYLFGALLLILALLVAVSPETADPSPPQLGDRSRSRSHRRRGAPSSRRRRPDSRPSPSTGSSTPWPRPSSPGRCARRPTRSPAPWPSPRSRPGRSRSWR